MSRLKHTALIGLAEAASLGFMVDWPFPSRGWRGDGNKCEQKEKLSSDAAHCWPQPNYRKLWS